MGKGEVSDFDLGRGESFSRVGDYIVGIYKAFEDKNDYFPKSCILSIIFLNRTIIYRISFAHYKYFFERPPFCF